MTDPTNRQTNNISSNELKTPSYGGNERINNNLFLQQIDNDDDLNRPDLKQIRENHLLSNNNNQSTLKQCKLNEITMTDDFAW